MCTVCGCGSGTMTIEDHGHGEEAHTHRHRHADGTEHSHPHTHEGEHAHSHEGLVEHSHVHRHADGTEHSHWHTHEDDHPHGHGEPVEHEHTHGPAGDRSRYSGDPAAFGHGHAHHGHGPAHSHAPGMSRTRMVQIEQDLLAENNRYAAANRRYFAERGIFALNLVSSPGSGKTTLLVRTIEALKGRMPIAVIEGDQQTSLDADRIRATGVPSLQINTGKGCHLDAHMVGHALERLNPVPESVVMIENVGNLVCPAGFDLGEAHKVVILSVTEGEDKPLKYPDMFHAADLMLLNKVDLLPHLSFDVERCIEYARRVKPGIRVLQVSATRGDGLDEWLAWIEEGARAAAAVRRDTIDALRRRNAELERELAALKARLGERT